MLNDTLGQVLYFGTQIMTLISLIYLKLKLRATLFNFLSISVILEMVADFFLVGINHATKPSYFGSRLKIFRLNVQAAAIGF